MEDKTIQLKLELEVARANANVKKFNQELLKMDGRTKEAKQKLAQLRLESQNLANAKKKLIDATSGVSKGLTGVSQASGSATSSVLEFGRVLSDAPYGIRGVANNLSQLSSNILFTSTKIDEVTGKTIGFKGALKEIGRAFTGPLGVLVVVQGAIAIFEYLANNVEKASEEVKELTKSFDELLVKIGLISPELKNIPTEVDKMISKITSELGGTEIENLPEKYLLELSDSLKIMNNEFPEFKNGFDKLSDSQKKNSEATTNLLIKYKELTNVRSRATVVLEKIQSLQDKIDKGEIKREFTNIDALGKEYRQLLLNKVALEELFKKEKTAGSSRNRVNKIFKEQILDLQKFILQKQRDAEKSKERNVMNLLKIDQRYAVEDLKLTHDTFVEKQKLRFQQWLETEASRKKMSVEEFKNSKKTKIFYEKEKAKLDKSLKDAQIEFDTASDNQKLAQEAAYQRKRLEITEKFNNLILNANLKSAQVEAQARLGGYDGTNAGSLGSPQSKVGADGIDAQIAIKESLMAEEQANFEETLAIKLQNLENQGFLLAEREAIIAEDRFQFQTDMVTRELELEQMKIDAKRSINEEYISWLGGLGSIMSDLAGENETLATVALMLEKGAAIADIIVKTQSANAKVTLAASEEAAGYNATAGLYSANPAAAAGYIAMAKAAAIRGKTRVVKNNVGAGISIAKIAATTLQSRSQGGGGGSNSSGGGGGRTFDFNLVGSTGENQLAQGIAGQLGNPVQAYVVSSQMTSQQQLDNAIQASATLGD